MTKVDAASELLSEREPQVRAIYTRLINALAPIGSFEQDAKKTSIHLVHGTAFAGVHPRAKGILLNIRTAAPIVSPRVRKLEQVSRNRCHNEILLETPDDVDAEIVKWLTAAYALSSK
jgi:hypothetical protein